MPLPATLSNILYMEKQEAIIEERTLEITKKNKELENAVTELRRLSREKELILNSAGDGIFGLDLDGQDYILQSSGRIHIGVR